MVIHARRAIGSYFIVRMQYRKKAGLKPVFHTHDEIGTDTPEGADHKLLGQIMEDIPTWAEGLPIVAEASRMEYYRK